MSGIEIAGLVLGAFPLLIHALENYREGAEALRDWWRIERAYKKCKQDLSYHQILFEGNVEQFLLPLVVDDDELKALMDDPAGQSWEDPALEQRLKDRLPKSYTLFLDIIGDISSLVDSMRTELGVKNVRFHAKIDQDHKLYKAGASRIDLMSMSNIEFQARRIKFTVKKSTRERLFAQLEEANNRMRNLLESSDKTIAARKNRESASPRSLMSRKMNDFWRHAKRLHDALSSAWQCSCASHITNLGLEHRTSDKVEFHLLFQLGTAQPKSWHDTRIKMLATSSNTSISVSQHGSNRPPKVRWDITTTAPEGSGNPQTTQIQDLCKTLSSKCTGCYGFIDEDEYRFMLYQGSQTTERHEPSVVTLEQLLKGTRTITRRNRYSLALTLASSYLQLGSTPWLHNQLRKDSIMFLQDPVHRDISLNHPYICQDLSNQIGQTTTGAIAHLGIRLLELCFGSALENTDFRRQLPIGDDISGPILDYAAAIQWSKLVAEEAGPEFAEAIDWCLHVKEVNDGSWRKELWHQVILPLDTCHKQVSQKLPVP